jgi:hypothetical protein
VSEYFFCPKSLSIGEGFVQTSTLVMRRSVLLRVPFLPELACGQEMTLLLRCACDENLELTILSEPLVIFNDFQSRARISIAPKWKTLFNWSRANWEYFTPAAYSSFMATICIQYAKSSNEPLATYLVLFRECLRGRPSLKIIFMFFARWWAPSGVRRKGATILKRAGQLIRGEAI